MTAPRLILFGMAVLSFVAGAVVEGFFLLAVIAVLQWFRPGAQYRTWV